VLSRTQQLLDRWVELGKQQDWLMQLRTTPTCLTVHDLTTVYEYAWRHRVSVESCNFIDQPEFFRISVLPKKQREQVSLDLKQWIESHEVEDTDTVINTRNPSLARVQIVQDANSYLNYLDSSLDESHRFPDLVAYLKRLEHNRGNSIITYLPQYEDLFRSQGY
jgi:hypothetical protein